MGYIYDTCFEIELSDLYSKEDAIKRVKSTINKLWEPCEAFHFYVCGRYVVKKRESYELVREGKFGMSGGWREKAMDSDDDDNILYYDYANKKFVPYEEVDEVDVWLIDAKFMEPTTIMELIEETFEDIDDSKEEDEAIEFFITVIFAFGSVECTSPLF